MSPFFSFQCHGKQIFSVNTSFNKEYLQFRQCLCVFESYIFPAMTHFFLFDLEAVSVIKVNNCAVVFGFSVASLKGKVKCLFAKSFFFLFFFFCIICLNM